MVVETGESSKLGNESNDLRKRFCVFGSQCSHLTLEKREVEMSAGESCAKCQQVIDTDSVALKDVGTFHKKCFVCSSSGCGVFLLGEGETVHMKSGNLLCSVRPPLCVV